MNKGLFDFIVNSPTAFHTVENIKVKLESSGFTELFEGESWDIKKGNNYFIRRNSSSLIALKIPENNINGFMIAASHSDSPCFKLKENPTLSENGYTKFSCEKYGGMINSTWLDRPLSVAGRVVCKSENSIKSTLVDFKEGVAIIPSVAIHLNRKANEDTSLNAAIDLVPLYADGDKSADFKLSVANLAGLDVNDILSLDLFIYNMDKPLLWQNYISAPRLDDLQCVFASLTSFVDSEVSDSIPVFAVFDNEEVGSSTKQGADSDFLQAVFTKIAHSLNIDNAKYCDLLSNSFMLSCDNGHAVHPNHPELTDKNNSVRLNGGVVIKYNANQRYCTDGISSSLVKILCERADVPYQTYANRSDIPGGSTLGNIANTHLSMITADIGLPQLSMHSAFETAGEKDTEYLYKLLCEFFSSTLRKQGYDTYII